MDFEDEDREPQRTFWQRYRISFVVIGLLLAATVTIAKLASGSHGSSRRDAITIVSLPPPPPPPPPPQNTPPPVQEERRMEQPMIKEDQPKAAPPKDEPPLGTGIKGSGPGDAFGLGSQSGNGRIGGTEGSGSKWGWYASQVQSRIQQAMQQNHKTRSASLSVNVRVWPDSGGRITRAQLASSTGDSTLDSAIRDEILTGLQLQEPPPPGMPTPITLRVAARRPR